MLLWVNHVYAADTAINLASIEIIANDTWNFNEQYTITVLTKNLEGNATDVEEMQITLIENVNHTESRKIIRKSIGRYTKNFYINQTQNLTEVHFNITAKERGKNVNEMYTVTFEQRNDLSRYYDTSKKYMKNTYEMIKENLFEYWLPLLIIIFAAMTLIVFFDLFFRRKKK